MRVVVDTNVMISACLTPDGLEAHTLALTSDGTLTACVSPATLAEYREVLARRKFASRRPRMEELLARLESKALVVEPEGTIALATDEDDNRFLECAIAARAQYLVTGNLRDYPPSLGDLRIVNARQFLNAISRLPSVGPVLR